MGFLDGVIAVVGGVPRRILCQRLIIKRLFVQRKKAIQANQFRDTQSNIVPVHLNIRAVALFQHDALAAMIFIAAVFSGYSMSAPADAVLLFQKIDALFGNVRGLEKLIDAGLSALKAASVCKGICDFILRDESAGFRDRCHVGAIFFAR